jgi:nickel-dependent lactate racemase
VLLAVSLCNYGNGNLGVQTMKWEKLIEQIDYHHKKWFLKTDGKWHEVPTLELYKRFAQLGVDDYGAVMKQFHYRDREATARKT